MNAKRSTPPEPIEAEQLPRARVERGPCQPDQLWAIGRQLERIDRRLQTLTLFAAAIAAGVLLLALLAAVTLLAAL